MGPFIVPKEVVHNTLFVGTSNGLYILRDGRLTRFRFEPNLEGKFEPVHDPIPERKTK